MIVRESLYEGLKPLKSILSQIPGLTKERLDREFEYTWELIDYHNDGDDIYSLLFITFDNSANENYYEVYQYYELSERLVYIDLWKVSEGIPRKYMKMFKRLLSDVTNEGLKPVKNTIESRLAEISPKLSFKIEPGLLNIWQDGRPDVIDVMIYILDSLDVEYSFVKSNFIRIAGREFETFKKLLLDGTIYKVYEDAYKDINEGLKPLKNLFYVEHKDGDVVFWDDETKKWASYVYYSDGAIFYYPKHALNSSIGHADNLEDAKKIIQHHQSQSTNEGLKPSKKKQVLWPKRSDANIVLFYSDADRSDSSEFYAWFSKEKRLISTESLETVSMNVNTEEEALEIADKHYRDNYINGMFLEEGLKPLKNLFPFRETHSSDGDILFWDDRYVRYAYYEEKTIWRVSQGNGINKYIGTAETEDVAKKIILDDYLKHKKKSVQEGLKPLPYKFPFEINNQGSNTQFSLPADWKWTYIWLHSENIHEVHKAARHPICLGSAYTLEEAKELILDDYLKHNN